MSEGKSPVLGPGKRARTRARSRSTSLILGLASALALSGCTPSEGDATPEAPSGGGEGQSATLRITDASGKILTFQAPPKRIVSLVPAATRTLQLLGAGERLAGRTRYDTAASLAHLPSVGGGLSPNLEALITLEPDLVIRFEGESDPATPARLDDLGIRHLSLRLDRISQVRDVILDLGALVGAGEEALELLRRMDASLDETRERVVGEAPIRVAYVLGGSPPWVAGPGTFIHEILGIAGGENVFSDLNALYGPVSPEEFLEREIDLVLTTQGTDLSLPSRDISQITLPPGIEIPGPELAEIARSMAELLHPEVFR